MMAIFWKAPVRSAGILLAAAILTNTILSVCLSHPLGNFGLLCRAALLLLCGIAARDASDWKELSEKSFFIQWAKKVSQVL